MSDSEVKRKRSHSDDEVEEEADSSLSKRTKAEDGDSTSKADEGAANGGTSETGDGEAKTVVANEKSPAAPEKPIELLNEKESKKEEPNATKSEAAPVSEEKGSDTASKPSGFGRFGAVSSAPKGGFGAAASSVPSSGFGAATAGGSGGGGIWAKAAAQHATPSGFGGFGAAAKGPVSAPIKPLLAEGGAEDDDEDGGDDEAAVDDEVPIEKKELIPGLSADYDVRTGEEDEVVIHQCRSRLYHLNAETKTWTSLGEGTLNMNEGKDEDGNKKYRLVLRCVGSKRLLLNARLFEGMVVDLVSPKQIRFGVVEQDDGAATARPTTYLIASSLMDTSALLEKIKARLKIASVNKSSSATDEADAAAAGEVTFTKAASNLQDIAREKA